MKCPKPDDVERVRLKCIKAHPDRATMDDVTFLVEWIEELQQELSLIRAKAYSRGGKVR